MQCEWLLSPMMTCTHFSGSVPNLFGMFMLRNSVSDLLMCVSTRRTRFLVLIECGDSLSFLFPRLRILSFFMFPHLRVLGWILSVSRTNFPVLRVAQFLRGGSLHTRHEVGQPRARCPGRSSASPGPPSRHPGPRATSAPRGEACPGLCGCQRPSRHCCRSTAKPPPSNPSPRQATKSPSRSTLPLQNSMLWPFCFLLQCFTPTPSPSTSLRSWTFATIHSPNRSPRTHPLVVSFLLFVLPHQPLRSDQVPGDPLHPRFASFRRPRHALTDLHHSVLNVAPVLAQVIQRRLLASKPSVLVND